MPRPNLGPVLKRPRPAYYHHLRTHFSSSTSNTTESDLYSNFLRKCTQVSNFLRGKAIHAKFIKGWIPLSLYLHNHILNFYVRCGDLDKARQLFDEMPQRNVVSWTAIISGFVQQGFAQKALSCFRDMSRDGIVRPNEFTFVSVLHACSLHQDLSLAYQVYAAILRLGFECNVFLTNAFLTALIRHGQLVEALEVFDNCCNKDIVSWNAVLAGYLQHSCFDVPRFWLRMNYEGVKPDGFTFSSVLTALASLSDMTLGFQVHAQLVKSGHGDETCVGNSLVDMYVKNQTLANGFKAFHEMQFKDVCSWTQMAAGCLQCGEPGLALDLIAEMRKMGLKPNKFTLSTAFNACATLPSWEEGKKFHGLRIKLGKEIDVCVDNALLDMYAKCGSMANARAVFRSINNRSVVSWTTMIMGCAQNGEAREALKVFDEMIQEGMEPNYVTFISVLYACSQGGFIDEGWKYFSSMSRDYGISPGEDHYACMVNLLGRSGLIKEAETLISEMPFEPGLLVWQTLLGACQVHGDIETGKRAAERAINLDKTHPSSYVLLSNMFADSNNWHGVGNLRGIMETSYVKKMPGSSWIGNLR